jgi:MerR family transcriptional regulator, redox-sensitive transcriptional activator SoxR
VAKEFSVGEVAERAGIAVSALHFYERKGLVRSYRTGGNQRRYEKDVLRRLAVIKLANELGIPLSRVAEAMAALPQGRSPTKDDWAALSAGWKAELDRRIVLLSRVRDELTGCIGCGCLSMVRCPLFNPEDAMRTEGAGPRRLLRAGKDVGGTD